MTTTEQLRKRLAHAESVVADLRREIERRETVTETEPEAPAKAASTKKAGA